MNCECVFVSKTDRNDLSLLENLADIINALNIDLEPWYISNITRTVNGYNAVDPALFPGETKRKTTTLHKNDLILFVGGKYHYMFKRSLYPHLTTEQKRIVQDFIICFPSIEEEGFFEDIKGYY